MTKRIFSTALQSGAALLGSGLLVASLGARQQPPAGPTPQSGTPLQQPDEINSIIRPDPGAQTRLAVPDFIALSPDKETADAAKVIARVLWDDLNFEHEYAFIPRDIYASVPPAKGIEDINYDAWRELNADGVVVGTVQKTATGVRVQVRLFNIRQHVSALGKEYTGSIANPRLYAHTIADEIHHSQRALKGVAQTKLTFASDRDGERLAGTVENRGSKEIYIADYDGENQRRITVGFNLNISPTWSPDARALVYTSYKQCTAGRGCAPGLPNIFVQHIYESLGPQELTSNSGQNFLPVWSPDGTRIAFASNRDQPGGSDIYVMNPDGSGVKRLTTGRGVINITPTWSPTGNQIAFTSDRTGSKQIWTMDADGLSQRQLTHEEEVDRPTWSPAPYNEIAYSAKTGPGNDIKIMDVATLKTRLLTDGIGNNESPAFSPNGRHIAFTSSRAGKNQIFTISRTGQDLKQITKAGNNTYPNWSNGPVIKD
jgi:TolB protein